MDEFDEVDAVDAVRVTFELPTGERISVGISVVALSWLESAGLLELFRDVVVARTPMDRHDDTYGERVEQFLSMQHAPAEVLESFRQDD